MPYAAWRLLFGTDGNEPGWLTNLIVETERLLKGFYTLSPWERERLAANLNRLADYVDHLAAQGEDNEDHSQVG
jgi:hypothetical protein